MKVLGPKIFDRGTCCKLCFQLHVHDIMCIRLFDVEQGNKNQANY